MPLAVERPTGSGVPDDAPASGGPSPAPAKRPYRARSGNGARTIWPWDPPGCMQHCMQERGAVCSSFISYYTYRANENCNPGPVVSPCFSSLKNCVSFQGRRPRRSRFNMLHIGPAQGAACCTPGHFPSKIGPARCNMLHLPNRSAAEATRRGGWYTA